MPSNDKTPNLKLNKWIGNEFPKRQDFVDDNEKIDKAFKDMQDNLANAAPVKRVNGKIGDVVLKAEDIEGEGGKSVAVELAETTKEIDNLKTSVDNGKDGLYSAIIGKKVTPRSKDFDDLKTAINNIKLGSGNAQACDVLKGKSFTNDSGMIQIGNLEIKNIKYPDLSKILKEKGLEISDNNTLEDITNKIKQINISIVKTGYISGSCNVRDSNKLRVVFPFEPKDIKIMGYFDYHISHKHRHDDHVKGSITLTATNYNGSLSATGVSSTSEGDTMPGVYGNITKINNTTYEFYARVCYSDLSGAGTVRNFRYEITT